MVTFRKLIFEDLGFLNSVRNSYAWEYLHNSTVFSLEETRSWFLKEKPEFYVIELENVRIGYFRVSNHSWVNKNLYVGADIHPNYVGRGLGYVSYKLFLPFIFEKYDLHKVYLEVLATNERAIKLYKKLNFKIEGRKREDLLKNDVWVDSLLMSLLKTELNTCL